MTYNNDGMTAEIKLGVGLQIAAYMLEEQTAHLEAGEVRTLLEKAHGRKNVWDDEEFSSKFAVVVFDPPLVHVIRRRDKRRGTVYFTDSPRFYFSFNAESSKNDN